jgi:hypothetical protein
MCREAIMATRAPKLTVVKADGTKEQYFHTKVVGTIANALGSAGHPDIHAAQEIADAVTFFLYRAAQPGDSKRQQSQSVNIISSEN